MYPKIIIDLEKLRNNVRTLVNIGKDKGIQIAGVTKVFSGNPQIAQAYVDGGVGFLADSRIENIMKLKDINIPKIMLRLPMLSEVKNLVTYADLSLQSELATLEAISEEALKQNKVHRIILMADLGDLREGYYTESDLMDAVGQILKLKGVKLAGIGTNLTCYGGVIPKIDHMDKLMKMKKDIEASFGISLDILSGGNSSSIYLLEDSDLGLVNNLRLGESLVLGTESAYGTQIKGTRDDVFMVQAQIIEVKEKPSVPTGEIGRDAFGKVPSFVDRGVRKRILCAIGKQDIDFDSLYPIDQGVIILGGSSDHIILDGTDSSVDYKVGDIIDFKVHYVSILRAMTSEYVYKEIIN